MAAIFYGFAFVLAVGVAAFGSGLALADTFMRASRGKPLF